MGPDSPLLGRRAPGLRIPHSLNWYSPSESQSKRATASGLYYLSEFVEEHSQLAKRTLQRLIYVPLQTRVNQSNHQVIIGIHVLLLIFDKFPFLLTAFSILAHVIYSTNLRKFPFISLTSPSFIASCGTPPPPPPQAELTPARSLRPPGPLLLLPPLFLLPSSPLKILQPLLHQPHEHHSRARHPYFRTGRRFLRDLCVARAVWTVCVVVGGGVGVADDGE